MKFKRLHSYLTQICESIAEKEVEKLLRLILQNTKFANKAHAVGGYVRDEIMGLEAKDLDIVVDLKNGAYEITKFIHELFPNEITTPHQLSERYPIWQITFKDDIEYNENVFKTKGAVIEFADAMEEIFPDKSSRQREVVSSTIEKDIERRDFTTNMLLKDMTTGEILDLTGTSINDIKRGILRGHPGVSLDKIFEDDPLRMIRLIRFQVKYGWDIPIGVLKTVKRNAERIKIVSQERIVDELKKIMLMGKLVNAIKLMKTTGLLRYILPEVQNLIGVEQPQQYHKEGDVYTHTLMVLQNAPKTIEGQLSALLHDVGKPATQEIIGDSIKFNGHDDTSAEIAEVILRRMKFDSTTINNVKTIVKNHMRPHHLANDSSEKALRKFIREIGDNLIDAVLDQADADERGSIPYKDGVTNLRKRIKNIQSSPIKVPKKPILNGIEIMEILGVKPSDKIRLPEIGKATHALIELADDYASEGKELSKEDAKHFLLNSSDFSSSE